MVIAIAATSKLGAVPALINSVLRAELEGFGHRFRTLSLSLPSFPPLQLSAEACAAANIVQLRHEDLYAAAYDAGPRTSRLLKDVGALIFTSGTSGKPKAVAVKNSLLIVVSTPFTVDAKNAARYLPLPRKFSASRFTAQLVKSGATRMLYVGELCRYLVDAPPSPYDQAHRCIKRFRIPEIREVYRSTEGVAKFDNFTHRKAGAGMVGFAGPVKLYSEKDVFLVKYDPST
ncbi:hypothetical protein NW757_013297 [Fusarium falciforme]|nr:hypothetical protein NW757_013297 [Fusarium falciforme]